MNRTLIDLIWKIRSISVPFRIDWMVVCRCWLGGEILIPKEKLVHRPGAYGIVRRGDAVLLMTTVGENGRYCLPGGGIEPWESNIAALAACRKSKL
jgi:hypothetical protein